MNGALPWFRLWAEAVDDEKLRLLAFEDRWHFVALLCCKAQGLLNDPGELMMRKVAVKLGLQLRELDEVARRLAEVGLIDRATLQPIAWDRRQYVSDRSTERVREFRKRKLGCETRNDDETFQKRSRNAPETETETDTEKKQTSSVVVASLPRSDQDTPTENGNGKSRPCPYDEIRAAWCEILPNLRQPLPTDSWTTARKAIVRARWQRDLPDIETWREVFQAVAQSQFLTGRVEGRNGQRPFQADLFWICKPENLSKLAEGAYT